MHIVCEPYMFMSAFSSSHKIDKDKHCNQENQHNQHIFENIAVLLNILIFLLEINGMPNSMKCIYLHL